MIKITADLLSRAMGIPRARAELWADPIAEAARLYGIDQSLNRMGDFIATVGHETLGLSHPREIWGPTPAQRRYEGRKDLGNVVAGDGKRFMGRGGIHVTGRTNYAMVRDQLRVRMTDVPDFEAAPHMLEQPRWAALSAGAFWHRKMLNVLADRGEFLKQQIRVNGKNANGLPNGWDDRQERRARAQRVLAAMEG